MWWKYILEAVFVVVLLGLGSSFWSLLKAPAHLRSVLKDKTELRAFLNFLGEEKVIEEAEAVEPVFGSFAGNIEFWHKAHFLSLRRSWTTIIVLCLGVLAATYFIGLRYLAANIILFFALSLVPILASAKDHNITHIHTILVNVMKWQSVDPEGCSHYCRELDPQFHELFEVANELEQASARSH